MHGTNVAEKSVQVWVDAGRACGVHWARLGLARPGCSIDCFNERPRRTPTDPGDVHVHRGQWGSVASTISSQLSVPTIATSSGTPRPVSRRASVTLRGSKSLPQYVNAE